MSIRCVITGCALVSGHLWVAGDLFDAGTCWIFNGNVNSAVGDKTVTPEWLQIHSCHYEKRLEPDDWFERRGMFVIEKSAANLNEQALEYIT